MPVMDPSPSESPASLSAIWGMTRDEFQQHVNPSQGGGLEIPVGAFSSSGSFDSGSVTSSGNHSGSTPPIGGSHRNVMETNSNLYALSSLLTNPTDYLPVLSPDFTRLIEVPCTHIVHNNGMKRLLDSQRRKKPPRRQAFQGYPVLCAFNFDKSNSCPAGVQGCTHIHLRGGSLEEYRSLPVHTSGRHKKLEDAIHERLPPGVSIPVWNTSKTQVVVVDSEMLYSTSGSRDAFRHFSAIHADASGNRNPLTEHALMERVKMQFCTHYLHDMCLRGSHCHFIHIVISNDRQYPDCVLKALHQATTATATHQSGSKHSVGSRSTASQPQSPQIPEQKQSQQPQQPTSQVQRQTSFTLSQTTFVQPPSYDPQQGGFTPQPQYQMVHASAPPPGSHSQGVTIVFAPPQPYGSQQQGHWILADNPQSQPMILQPPSNNTPPGQLPPPPYPGHRQGQPQPQQIVVFGCPPPGAHQILPVIPPPPQYTAPQETTTSMAKLE